MAKRIKYVYKTDEIPHLFVHQKVDRASNPQHNLSFENGVMQSYGYWPIGAHVTSPNGKKKAILLRSDRYSVTTTKQQSDLRRAVPSSFITFEVPNLGGDITHIIDHKKNLAHYVDDAKRHYETSKRARTGASYAFGQAWAMFEQAKAYVKFFNLPSVSKHFSFFPKGEKLTAYQADVIARTDRGTEARSTRWKIQRERSEAARAERERIEALEMPEKIAMWRDGLYVPTAYRFPTMLRIAKDGKHVETSRGAVVPVSHAKRGLKFVRSVIAGGAEYVRNGHTLHLGHYPIDRIETNGTLHAGCHIIPYAEIEAIAPMLETLADEKLIDGAHEVTA